jgi:hypothetical protein
MIFFSAARNLHSVILYQKPEYGFLPFLQYVPEEVKAGALTGT